MIYIVWKLDDVVCKTMFDGRHRARRWLRSARSIYEDRNLRVVSIVEGEVLRDQDLDIWMEDGTDE